MGLYLFEFEFDVPNGQMLMLAQMHFTLRLSLVLCKCLCSPRCILRSDLVWCSQVGTCKYSAFAFSCVALNNAAYTSQHRFHLHFRQHIQHLGRSVRDGANGGHETTRRRMETAWRLPTHIHSYEVADFCSKPRTHFRITVSCQSPVLLISVAPSQLLFGH
jgi:hypothetical protein